jgi:hypothetical protein
MPIEISTVDGKKFVLDTAGDDGTVLENFRKGAGVFNAQWVRVADVREVWVNRDQIVTVRTVEQRPQFSADD